ncbi:MAG: ParB/RepB/Spo0J family partition protein [Bdellovibrionales bacterium]|nr:ParB/RepB/Spo0J family partition protein [Bdellovibrionales bacterium]
MSLKPKMKRGLGRGLSALISSAPVPATPQSEEREESSSTIQSKESAWDGYRSQLQSTASAAGSSGTVVSERVRYLPIEEIEANPTQPRQHFNDQEISELADSIRALGVLQPVLVRTAPNASGKYQVVAGERRYRAAKKAGLKHLPVIVRELSERDVLEVAVVENVQRSDLTPMEEARAYDRLSSEFNLSQKEIAERVGKDRATVANVMRLLKLPEKVQELVENSKLSLGHAKAILTVKEPSAQMQLAEKVVREGLSVRSVEEIVSRVVVLDPKHRAKAQGRSRGDGESGAQSALEDSGEVVSRLRESLGTKVVLRHLQSGRGKIEIEYFSEEELQRLVERLCQ